MEQKSQNPPMMEPPPPYAGVGVPPGTTYMPPQAGYIGGQPAATVYPAQPVATAAVIVNVQGFGPYPMQVTCSHCSAQVMTETVASPGLLTWLLSGTLFLVGCWLGCCLIPCCIPECQDIEHRCPNCKTHLGTYRRL